VSAVDASVAIAAFASWHEDHTAALRALVPGSRIPAHAAAETYSVLTRLPEPFRFKPEVARRQIVETFTEPFLTLSARGYRRLIETAPAEGIVGGAIYDAIVAATAREAGETLLTRDRRAHRTYDAVRVRWELIE
jgi:predicted nucleic acid-binding protein